MQIFLKILKELGIAIIFILLILAILAFAFRDKVPFGKEVPDSVKYTSINKKDYDVRGDLEDKANATQTYQTSSKQLDTYLTEKIVSPGRFAPFDPVESIPDVPNETVLDLTSVPGDEGANGDVESEKKTTESTLE